MQQPDQGAPSSGNGAMERIAAAKAGADAALRKGNFRDAWHRYTDVLQMLGAVQPGSEAEADQQLLKRALLSNRCAAYTGAGRAELALQDAEELQRTWSSWPKAWFRGAKAREAARQYDTALQQYGLSWRLEPDDGGKQDVRRHMARCAAHLTLPQLADLLLRYLCAPDQDLPTSSTLPLPALAKPPTVSTLPTASTVGAAAAMDGVGDLLAVQVWRPVHVPKRPTSSQAMVVLASGAREVCLSGAEGVCEAELREASFLLVKKLKSQGAAHGWPYLTSRMVEWACQAGPGPEERPLLHAQLLGQLARWHSMAQQAQHAVHHAERAVLREPTEAALDRLALSCHTLGMAQLQHALALGPDSIIGTPAQAAAGASQLALPAALAAAAPATAAPAAAALATAAPATAAPAIAASAAAAGPSHQLPTPASSPSPIPLSPAHAAPGRQLPCPVATPGAAARHHPQPPAHAAPGAASHQPQPPAVAAPGAASHQPQPPALAAPGAASHQPQPPAIAAPGAAASHQPQPPALAAPGAAASHHPQPPVQAALGRGVYHEALLHLALACELCPGSSQYRASLSSDDTQLGGGLAVKQAVEAARAAVERLIHEANSPPSCKSPAERLIREASSPTTSTAPTERLIREASSPTTSTSPTTSLARSPSEVGANGQGACDGSSGSMGGAVDKDEAAAARQAGGIVPDAAADAVASARFGTAQDRAGPAQHSTGQDGAAVPGPNGVSRDTAAPVVPTTATLALPTTAPALPTTASVAGASSRKQGSPPASGTTHIRAPAALRLQLQLVFQPAAGGGRPRLTAGARQVLLAAVKAAAAAAAVASLEYEGGQNVAAGTSNGHSRAGTGSGSSQASVPLDITVVLGGVKVAPPATLAAPAAPAAPAAAAPAGSSSSSSSGSGGSLVVQVDVNMRSAVAAAGDIPAAGAAGAAAQLVGQLASVCLTHPMLFLEGISAQVTAGADAGAAELGPMDRMRSTCLVVTSVPPAGLNTTLAPVPPAGGPATLSVPLAGSTTTLTPAPPAGGTTAMAPLPPSSQPSSSPPQQQQEHYTHDSPTASRDRQNKPNQEAADGALAVSAPLDADGTPMAHSQLSATAAADTTQQLQLSVEKQQLQLAPAAAADTAQQQQLSTAAPARPLATPYAGYQLVDAWGRAVERPTKHPFAVSRVYYSAAELPSEEQQVWFQPSDNLCRWRQTATEVQVLVTQVPAGTSAKQLTVEIRAHTLEVRDRTAGGVFLSGCLERGVIAADSTWWCTDNNLGPGGDTAGGGCMILLTKMNLELHARGMQHADTWWPRLMRHHAPVAWDDTHKDYSDLPPQVLEAHTRQEGRSSRLAAAEACEKDELKALREQEAAHRARRTEALAAMMTAAA